MHPIVPAIVFFLIMMGDGPHPTTVVSTGYQLEKARRIRKRQRDSSQLHHTQWVNGSPTAGIVFYHD